MTDMDEAASASHLEHPDDGQTNISTIQTLNSNQTADPSVSNLTAPGILSMIFKYRPNGATFRDVQIYNASLKLLIGIAEADNQRSTIWPIMFAYNDMDDFTLTLRPASLSGRSLLSWHDAAIVLGFLGEHMSNEQPGGKWAELDGIIQLDGIMTGVFCIEKGKHGLEACDYVADKGIESS